MNLQAASYQGIGDVPYAVWEQELERYPTSPLLPYLPELYEILRGITALGITHLKRESEFETVRKSLQPEDGNPFNLRPNGSEKPAGMTGIKAGYLTFASPLDSAREFRRRVLDDPTYERIVYDANGREVARIRYRPDMTLAEYLATYAPVGDKHPVTGDANETYARDAMAILTRLEAREKALGVAPVASTAPTMKAHSLPGAPRSLYLPAEQVVSVRIVKSSRVTNQVVRMPKQGSVGHDTGNPSTDAEAEYRWLADGRPGGSLGGYTAIVDDRITIVTSQLNWETWHAGLDWWNKFTLGTELAYGGKVVWNKAYENWCAWLAATLECCGLTVDDFDYHQAVYGKYCPAQIFNRGLRASTIERIRYYWNLCRAARAGVSLPVDPVYVAPMPPMVDGKIWDGQKDVTINGVKFEAQRVKSKVIADALNMRQWASTESQFSGPGYKKGDEVELLGWVAGQLVNGISEWWVDTKGNRLWAGGIEEQPKIDPDFGQEPELTPGVIPVNGRLYYPLNYDGDDQSKWGTLGREITIRQNGELRRWADTDDAISPVVGTVKAGDTRTFKYWTRGEELPLPGADGATELIWFAEDLHSGARMWAGLATERPD